jgi:hypothetical protein
MIEKDLDRSGPITGSIGKSTAMALTITAREARAIAAGETSGAVSLIDAGVIGGSFRWTWENLLMAPSFCHLV